MQAIQKKYSWTILAVILSLTETVLSQPSSSVFANPKTETVKRLLSLADNDQQRIKLLQALSWSYAWSSPDSTLKYAATGLRLAQEQNLPETQIDFLTAMAQAHSGKGNLAQALKSNFRALNIASNRGNDEQEAWCYASIGSIYFYAEDFENALIYFLKTKQKPKAYRLKEKMYAGFIGETYFHLNQPDSAKLYLTRSYQLQVKSENHWSVPYLYMGKLAETGGRYPEAIAYYRASIRQNVPETDSIKAFIAIANNFKKRNITDSGIYFAKSAFLMADQVQLYRYIVDASLVLAELYRIKNQYDSVFAYQNILLAARDSMFSTRKMNQLQALTFDEEQRRLETENENEKLRNRIKFFGLLAGMFVFAIIAIFLFRSNRFKQKANLMLQQQKNKIEEQRAKVELALHELKSTQSQLIQSEKMASLGELTAGIAHEIQNPLNFVNNFSEVNRELIDELQAGLKSGNIDEAMAISGDIRENEEKINHHGKRADAIVKGMLQHSRTSSGQKESIDINALCDEYVRLAYHGLRAKDKSFNARFDTRFDEQVGMVSAVPQDIGRVILNLINNAFYAVNEKAGKGIPGYEPTVTVSTKAVEAAAGRKKSVLITVEDNGGGIPEAIRDKIFQPFFTTKPTGQGTGLGLSLAYDIVTKGHGGELKVETREGEGTSFLISIPISATNS